MHCCGLQDLVYLKVIRKRLLQKGPSLGTVSDADAFRLVGHPHHQPYYFLENRLLLLWLLQSVIDQRVGVWKLLQDFYCENQTLLPILIQLVNMFAAGFSLFLL